MKRVRMKLIGKGIYCQSIHNTIVSQVCHTAHVIRLPKQKFPVVLIYGPSFMLAFSVPL